MPIQSVKNSFINFKSQPFIRVESRQNTRTTELILYIANALAPKENYGQDLLYKALYFIDNVNYLFNRFPISKLTYMKLNNGPAPDQQLWASVQQDLLASGEIVVNDQKLIGTRNADMSHFTPKELEVINDVVFNIDNWSAESMPIKPYENLALIIADDKEPLPFFTFLVSASKQPPSQEQIDQALALIQKMRDSGELDENDEVRDVPGQ